MSRLNPHFLHKEVNSGEENILFFRSTFFMIKILLTSSVSIISSFSESFPSFDDIVLQLTLKKHTTNQQFIKFCLQLFFLGYVFMSKRFNLTVL